MIHRDLSEYNSNVRISDMLSRCSDSHAIALAETIAANRLAGLETYTMERILNEELTRMFAATRVLNGKIPDSVKYIKRKEHGE